MPALILLLLATIGFTLLNWTTALVHMQIFLCLLLARMVPWRRLVLYAVFGFVSAALVVCASVASKMSVGGPHPVPFTQFLAGYTWGGSAYSSFIPSTSATATLLVRIAFANILGLLPLWIIWGWILMRNVRAEPIRVAVSLAPIGLAALLAVGMRNYIGSQPWTTATLFLMGIVLSLFMVLRLAALSTTPPSTTRTTGRYLIWAATFGFGFVVLLFYREHQSRVISLVSLVRSHSARGDGIVVVRSVDAKTASLAVSPYPGVAARLSEQLDRWLLVVDALPDPAHPIPASFLLSAVPLAGDWPLAARSGNDPLQSLPLLHGALDWFSKTIARRAPGDRMDLAETYYLYRVPPNLRASTQDAGAVPSLPPQKQ
jgi:hypothetical protein